MARKKRNRGDSPPDTAAAPRAEAPAAGAAALAAGLPAEAASGSIVGIFALMMFLAPALGVPNEEMLQDTLKSIIVSFAVLGAALLFFWQQRKRREPLRWHAVVWLPLLLMAYALGSMAWSHTYLAGVEAIRWFIFALLTWLGINSAHARTAAGPGLGHPHGRGRGIAVGGAAVLGGFQVLSPGPAPRVHVRQPQLLCRIRGVHLAVFRRAARAFAAKRTGGAAGSDHRADRSRRPHDGRAQRLDRPLAAAAGGAAADRLALPQAVCHGRPAAGARGWWPWAYCSAPCWAWASIPSGDPKIAEEGRGLTALERGFKRTGSISPGDASLGVRMVMWKATVRAIQGRPLSGVGAGAWESEIPLYQAEGSQLETDYYVHNEFLQLLAEYGLAGWVFLLALAAYLLDAARRTLAGKSEQAQAEAPWRAILLCSLLALMIVSNVGFPWRMASTGALFALCLAGLAASDARLGLSRRWAAARLAWSPNLSHAMATAMAACIVLAAYITQQAAECEQKIVQATKIALTISASGEPNNPKWNRSKADMLRLIREGIAINPHYRKITPMVADELARWGDWRDATWIWESVLSSRPHIVAIMSNVARGYATMGQPAKALEYLERARKIQPRAPAVRSLEVILLGRTGQEARALELARQAMAENIYDFDMTNAAFVLGSRAGDYAFADKAVQLRMKGWPETRLQGYMQLGDMYGKLAKDPDRALGAFRQAMDLASPAQRQSLLPQIPAVYWPKLGYAGGPQAPASAQTSANKG